MNILVVKLSDIGDVLTATPALRALREGLPGAHISLLVPPHSAAVIEGSPLVDQVLRFDKAKFDNPLKSLNLGAFGASASLLGRLREGRFDAAAIMHHLTTRWGALKYAALALGSGAPRRLGLDNGRGWFLTDRIRDRGFGGMHEARYWLEVAGLLGGRVKDYPLEVSVSPEDERFAEEHLPPSTSGPRIALHPGSGNYSLARRWPAIGFAEVARGLAERYGAQLVMVGGGNERDLAEEVAWGIEPPPLNLAGKTTLKQLAAVLRRCQLFIGNDSGVMHLAVAAGTPTVAIFGLSNHRAWGPWLGEAEVVRAEIPCSPCLYVGGGIGKLRGCHSMECQTAVSPSMVLAAAERLLRSAKREAGSEEPEARRAPIHGTEDAEPVSILGIRIDNLTENDAVQRIEDFIESGTPHQVVTVNPEFLVQARDDANFRSVLASADLALADGAGLLWASRLMGQPLKARVTGVDLLRKLAKLAAKKKYRVFLLGAAEGVAERAAEVLRRECPGLDIVGTYAGSPSPEEEDVIIDMVSHAQPHMLFVAFGAPRQDLWISRNLQRAGVPVAIGVGGAFDFVSGRIKRAPPRMRRLGLEWLYRLYREPWRWRRMLRLPVFVWLVFWSKFAGNER